MVGAVATEGTLGDRLVLGYRHAALRCDTPVGPQGTILRGHEFHYSTCAPAGTAVRLASRFGERDDGFATPRLFATYLHHHAGGDPSPEAAFVRTCVEAKAAACSG